MDFLPTGQYVNTPFRGTQKLVVLLVDQDGDDLDADDDDHDDDPCWRSLGAA